jgi:hypothetical protein
LEFEHLVVAGKEPFADNRSLEISKLLIELCYKAGKTISFITNGVNLYLLENIDLQKIKYIDVSFDGGINSYKQYRGGDIIKILHNINTLKERGLKKINALHILSKKTIANLSDMLMLNYYADFDKMMFSPYLDTQGFVHRNEKVLPLVDIISALQSNEYFHRFENSFLLLDKYNFEKERELSIENIDEYLKNKVIASKVLVVKKDPIEYGFIRVTYNGFVLTPTDSLHTANYGVNQVPLSEYNNNVFSEMLNDEKVRHKLTI